MRTHLFCKQTAHFVWAANDFSWLVKSSICTNIVNGNTSDAVSVCHAKARQQTLLVLSAHFPPRKFPLCNEFGINSTGESTMENWAEKGHYLWETAKISIKCARDVTSLLIFWMIPSIIHMPGNWQRKKATEDCKTNVTAWVTGLVYLV